MQGLFIYVLTYFVRYSMNAVNADAECRYGMINPVRKKAVTKKTKQKKEAYFFLLAVVSYFNPKNLIYFITYIRDFYVFKCFNHCLMF